MLTTMLFYTIMRLAPVVEIGCENVLAWSAEEIKTAQQGKYDLLCDYGDE